MPFIWVIAIITLVLATAAAWWWHQAFQRRQQAMREVLDAADALERRLRAARAQAGAQAGAEHDPVREPLQEMLRHRLWLQQHGRSARLQQLQQVRDAMLQAAAKLQAMG